MLMLVPIAGATSQYRLTPATITPVEETVYVTKTGEKYDRNGCQYLSKSKRAIGLSDAKAAGYSPCSRCKPKK